MGEVYRARDSRLAREGAIRRRRGGEDEAQERAESRGARGSSP
jgi:hypothetical protein